MYLRTGDEYLRIACQQQLAARVPCRDNLSSTQATLQFSVRRWAESRLQATEELFRRYVGAGELHLDEPICITEKASVHAENHGKLPLEVAVRWRNVPATLAMVRAGALEVTDFREIHPSYLRDAQKDAPLDTIGDGRLLAFEQFCASQWPDLVHVSAQITQALMARRIDAQCASDQACGAAQPLSSSARRRGGRIL